MALPPCIEVEQIGRRAASFTTFTTTGWQVRVQILKKGREAVDQLEFVHSLLYELARAENAELVAREDNTESSPRRQQLGQSVVKRKMDTAKVLRCKMSNWD